MLAHLHAHFVDGDLLYDNEYAALGMSPLFAFVTSQGVVSNHWPAGATWLQAPGYLLGLLANRALAGLQTAAYNPLGVVPLLAVRAWAMLVAVACVVAVGRAFAHAGRGRAGWVGALAYLVGTPLLYYASEAPLRPHLWGQAVMLALVLGWMRPRLGSPVTRTVVLSALAGLATAVRPQLAVCWLLVIHDAWPDGRARWQRLGWGALAFAVWPLTHLRVQLWMYGGRLGDYAGEVTHHLWHFLFSPYHGALSWSPVLALGLGLVAWAAVTRQRGGVLIAVIVALQIWLDAGMRDIEAFSVLGTRTWAGGVSFGARKLVDVLPLLLPSALAFAERSVGHKGRAPLAALVVALVVPTALLHLAAFINPHATTGAILDKPAFVQVLALPYDAAAWDTAWEQRALDPLVALVVTALVVVPLAFALCSAATRLATSHAVTRRRAIAAVVLGLGIAANLWLSFLQVRSDALLTTDPQRMRAVKARLQRAHELTVSRIPTHHARLRAILGPGAAP